jgi:hypothetical protein
MNTAKIKCNKCGSQFGFQFDFDLTDSDERNMGPENHYHADDQIGCDKCGNEISYDFYLSEYPAGSPNDTEFTVEGGELMDIQYQDPF